MIKDGDKMVKDFHSGEIVKRQSKSAQFGKCAGCGLSTRRYDHLFGWHVCLECDSDSIAADLSDHVMHPNRGIV